MYVPGHRNVLADALSRKNLNLFFSQDPKASKTPTEVPTQLVDLQVTVRPHWMSPAWSRPLTTDYGRLAHTTRTDELGARQYLKFYQVASRAPFPVREVKLTLLISLLHVEGLAPGTVPGSSEDWSN